MVGDAFAGIHQINHHMRLFHGLHGFNDAELFNGFLDSRASADTSRVDQSVLSAIAFEGNKDAVAGRAGLVEHHDPVFAEQAVN